MIHLRPAAVRELKRLLAKQSNPPSRLRLNLAAAGCSEWIYCLGPAVESEPGARIVVCGDLSIEVPDSALPLLENLTIDYSEDLMGGGFRFINPQAAHTCGCGNSFSLSPEPPSAPGDCTTPVPMS
ncbi:MAG: HesB/IscA family protein [Nodosilinea sp.]